MAEKNGGVIGRMTNVSDNLRSVLNELNMSQTEFAKSVGTSYGYLNMVINRRRNSISRQLALLIEEKYGYSAEWLLHDEGDRKINHFKCNKNYERMKNEIDQLSSEEVNRLGKFILFIDELNKEEQEKRKLKKQFRGSV